MVIWNPHYVNSHIILFVFRGSSTNIFIFCITPPSGYRLCLCPCPYFWLGLSNWRCQGVLPAKTSLRVPRGDMRNFHMSASWMKSPPEVFRIFCRINFPSRFRRIWLIFEWVLADKIEAFKKWEDPWFLIKCFWVVGQQWLSHPPWIAVPAASVRAGCQQWRRPFNPGRVLEGALNRDFHSKPSLTLRGPNTGHVEFFVSSSGSMSEQACINPPFRIRKYEEYGKKVTPSSFLQLIKIDRGVVLHQPHPRGGTSRPGLQQNPVGGPYTWWPKPTRFTGPPTPRDWGGKSHVPTPRPLNVPTGRFFVFLISKLEEETEGEGGKESEVGATIESKNRQGREWKAVDLESLILSFSKSVLPIVGAAGISEEVTHHGCGGGALVPYMVCPQVLDTESKDLWFSSWTQDPWVPFRSSGSMNTWIANIYFTFFTIIIIIFIIIKFIWPSVWM